MSGTYAKRAPHNAPGEATAHADRQAPARYPQTAVARNAWTLRISRTPTGAQRLDYQLPGGRRERLYAPAHVDAAGVSLDLFARGLLLGSRSVQPGDGWRS